MKITSNCQNDTALLRLEGSMERYTELGEIKRHALKLVQKEPAKLVLDANALEYASASFCGFIVSLHTRCSEHYIDFEVCVGDNGLLCQLLDVSGLMHVLNVRLEHATFL